MALRRRTLLAAGAAAAVAQPRAQQPPAQVDIRDMRFTPQTLSVKVGSTVRWTNNERRTTHSVLFLAPLSFEGERMFPGESWEYRFEHSGSYPYSCGPHPEMQGRIEVAP